MKTVLVWLGLTVSFVCGIIFLLNHGIQQFGAFAAHGSTSPEAAPFAALVLSIHQPVAQLLLQLVLIVVVARLFGRLFEKFGQPPVVGEMLAGITLGPSLIGSLAPSFSTFVFPKASMGNLQMLSQVGIILFMFVVGMELDANLLKQKAKSAILISQVSIAFPYFLGVALALVLYRGYAPAQTSFISFALFLGISMSITAFPVLARIIKEKGLTGSYLGTTAISCAAVDDVTAWCILAFIVALAKAQSMTGSIISMCLSLTFVALMFLIVRPVLEKISSKAQIIGEPGKGLTVVCLLTLFASALWTESTGIHAIFGGFLAGIVMPKDPVIRGFLRDRIEYFSTLILVPIFFAFTGLRTQVGLVSDMQSVGVLFAIIGVAVAGKFGGSMFAARLSGMSWRESTAIGALMNARGLIELIALNIGLDLGILSPKIFTMLVLMALVTTFATGPVIEWLGYGLQKNAQAVPGSELEGQGI